jgi:hypothetical protein
VKIATYKNDDGVELPIVQNTIWWEMARAGLPTASEFGNLITPLFKPRTGEMVESYFAMKLSERWTGTPTPGKKTPEMEFGSILEEKAKPHYTFMFNEEIIPCGFATTDDGRIGCSPDGLIGDKGGIELKCPEAKTHTKYLMAGKLPDDYVLQVYGSMFVTGRAWWKFMSYRRNFPAYVTTIERDEKINAVIEDTILAFCERLDAGFKRLCEMNGGPPFRAAVPQPQRAFTADDSEIPT